jgi:hypothetical protein
MFKLPFYVFNWIVLWEPYFHFTDMSAFLNIESVELEEHLSRFALKNSRLPSIHDSSEVTLLAE